MSQVKFTFQEIFDKAVFDMKNQNWIPSAGNNKCFYRGPKGRKCIVGHFIDDKYYNGDLETLPVSAYEVIHALGNTMVIDDSIVSCLHKLQIIHDSVDSWLRREFDTPCLRYNITNEKVKKRAKQLFIQEFQKFASTHSLKFLIPE